MDEEPLYDFEGDTHEDAKKSLIDDRYKEPVASQLRHMAASMTDLISGNQTDKLGNRGYVFVINGAWGAGKTTATWAIINEVEQKLNDGVSGEKLVKFEKSLLPFGSTTEAMTSFLDGVTCMLWSRGILDIRKAIKQFILEVTPSEEPQYSFSASLGPFSISRQLQRNTTNSTNAVRFYMAKLASKKRTLVLVLDDLDRLRQSEIVDIFRMIEKLRQMPRIIIFIPVNRHIITKAFNDDLGVGDPTAATFVRKLTDIELVIENPFAKLQSLFINEFSQELSAKFEDYLEDFGFTLGEVCWNMLLHCLVITEAVATVRTEQIDGTNANRLIDGTLSEYLQLFREELVKNQSSGREQPFPVKYSKDENSQPTDFYGVLSNVYVGVRENSNANALVTGIDRLRNVDEFLRPIYIQHEVQDALKQRVEAPVSDFPSEAKIVPMFREVLVSLLRSTQNEPMLTGNYKLRDMKILARRITGDRNFKPTDDVLRTLYNVVQDNYYAFRG